MAVPNETIKLDASTAETFRILLKKIDAEGLSLDIILRELIQKLDKKDSHSPKAPANKSKKEKKWTDVWKRLQAIPSDDYGPTDLSSNKKHMEGYGEW